MRGNAPSGLLFWSHGTKRSFGKWIKRTRWDRKDGIWMLRTTRQWLPRDLDVLKPLFERMRVQGLDFLDKNAALAEEVRRTFCTIWSRIEGELKKASSD